MILFIFGSLLSVPGILAIAPADVVPLIFGCLVFVFPIAGYCLFLAMINGRQRPTLMSGPWDFVGVLLALSGFLMVGGPIILGNIHPHLRASMVLGRLPSLRDLGGDSWFFWLLLCGVYFLIVLGGAGWVLWRRRAITVIYNVEPGLLNELLPRIFGHLKLDSSRTGNRLELSRGAEEIVGEPTQSIQAPRAFPESTSARLAVGIPAHAPAKVESGSWGRVRLEIDSFPAMYHVTLRWRGDDSIRRDVEAELARQFAEVVTPDNPAAGWLLTAATCLFGALLLGLVAFVLFLARR